MALIPALQQMPRLTMLNLRGKSGMTRANGGATWLGMRKRKKAVCLHLGVGLDGRVDGACGRLKGAGARALGYRAE